MIEQLRMLSPPVRLLVYLTGAVLLFVVSLGLGATAAALVGWQSEQTATGRSDTGPAGTSTSEKSMPETTGIAGALQATGIEPSGHPNERYDGAGEEVFIHRATDENSRADYTYISNPDIDGDPRAVVLAWVRQANGDVSYAHNIGVWYAPVAHKWAIFNEDLATVPAGSTFEVVVPASSASFVHRVKASNSAGNYTYIDSRLTNGNRDAVLQVTQNWNPGGGSGVYNDHPVGVIYDPKVDQWAIYNLDGARLPRGAAFNVGVKEGTSHPSG